MLACCTQMMDQIRSNVRRGRPTRAHATQAAPIWLAHRGHCSCVRAALGTRLQSKLREETEAAIEKSQTLRGCATLVLDNTAKKEVYVQLRKELE